MKIWFLSKRHSGLTPSQEAGDVLPLDGPP